ncbi:MAG: hypothetical protein J3K34DRAFT_403692 [Monoraphidium minutum]|nr:MAG: hypothetical protein J3K34DRAFT_403692 [Monoraphidium minutum]
MEARRPPSYIQLSGMGVRVWVSHKHTSPLSLAHASLYGACVASSSSSSAAERGPGSRALRAWCASVWTHSLGLMSPYVHLQRDFPPAHHAPRRRAADDEPASSSARAAPASASRSARTRGASVAAGALPNRLFLKSAPRRSPPATAYSMSSPPSTAAAAPRAQPRDCPSRPCVAVMALLPGSRATAKSRWVTSSVSR